MVPTPTEEGLQVHQRHEQQPAQRALRQRRPGGGRSRWRTSTARASTVRSPGSQFQRHWEAKAYELGGGSFHAPAQTVTDYLAGRVKQDLGGTSYRPGAARMDLNRLFPEAVTRSLKVALKKFDQRMRGFITQEAKLIGIESRTSSPLRITRGDDLHSVSLRGLYPGGEGCGYAGGIVSSGIDGLRIAEQIAKELQ